PLNIPRHVSATDLQQRRQDIIAAFTLNADAPPSVLTYLREAYYFVPLLLRSSLVIKYREENKPKGGAERCLMLRSSLVLSFSQEIHMSIRDLLWLQVLFHRFIHTYEERSSRMNWCTSFLPYCAVSLRSAAIRSA